MSISIGTKIGIGVAATALTATAYGGGKLAADAGQIPEMRASDRQDKYTKGSILSGVATLGVMGAGMNLALSEPRFDGSNPRLGAAGLIGFAGLAIAATAAGYLHGQAD